MNSEQAFWMTLAHDLTQYSFSFREGWKIEDKMNMIIKFHHDHRISIIDFFNLSIKDWVKDYELTDWQVKDLLQAKEQVANNSFTLELLQNNGIDVISRISPDYPDILKNNFRKASPIVLYAKGNKQILKESCAAIVGSREASKIAMQFTDNIAKRLSKEYKVVSSGFAKGVDKQALDSSIKYHGKSIIVLPQGILTFESGIRTYYQEILKGDVLVFSGFRPKANWSTDLAMARNALIYGLAHEIFVAEAKPIISKQGVESKGGTWAGALDGLKRGRKVYVRLPGPKEKNDNLELIQKGCIPVDMNGDIVEGDFGEGSEKPKQNKLF
ncbi:MAG: DNA-processing protein DprA [Candidatus Cloacimonetes bacterium]|nr:DNA-processing protein DprA [Candidatus Cloacimonadota bacterium]